MELLVLLLLSILPISTLTSLAATPVTDTTGQPLQKGASYYILPVFRGRGGGLTLAPLHRMCPLNVAQEDMEVINGIPLSFSPADPKSSTIQLSADVNIVFKAATICVQSTVWRVEEPVGAGGKRYVATAGVLGNPGAGTVSSWFRVDRYGKDYKLVFCPGVCSICRVACGDVGVFHEGGHRWLGLGGEAFPVMFKKAQ